MMHTQSSGKRWQQPLRRVARRLGTFAATTLLIWASALPLSAQKATLKTNLLIWGTTTPNASLEIALDRKHTLDLMAAYNPWTFRNGREMHCWLAQPELRHWMCERFEGHFVGIHAHAGQFFGGFHSKRYDGYLAGGGVSYGYAWILSPHWNVEAEVGVGYARLWYDESERTWCEKCTTPRHRNYVGPTRLGVNLSYCF